MGELAGFTVVVASEQRRHSLAELLKAQGIRTISLQTTRSVAPPAFPEIAPAPRTDGSLPPRTDVLRRMTWLAVRRQVDAVALTGPAITGSLLGQADLDGMLPDLLNALSGDVTALCLGEPAGRSLRGHGVSPAVASHPDDTDFFALLRTHLPSGSLTLTVDGQAMHIRSQTIVIGGEIIAVPPAPMAVLRALARRPGHVMSAASIRRDSPLWSGVDDHAVEMAVSRLRGRLRGTVLKHQCPVQTVNRRGYRLAV